MNRTAELAEFLNIALRGRIESVAQLAGRVSDGFGFGSSVVG